MDFGAQDEVVRFLASLEGGAERIVTTHISVVALCGTHAYKLKKAVRFPYLDFSTPSRRWEMCAREATLNASFAPELYLGAHRVTRERDGRLALDGAGEMIDAVVVMRRFADEDLFEQIAKDSRLTPVMVEALARLIAKTHDEAAPNDEKGGAAAMRRTLDDTALSLRNAAAASAEQIDSLVARLNGALDAQGALLDARKTRGKVRRCHGDLTLRNICLFEGAPTLFDCLEFDDEIATIDVLYDVSFLLMDLWRVGAFGCANLAFNRYLDARDETDGLPLLPFFMSLRAAIRAHVEASQQNLERARLYFDLAMTLLAPATGAVIAIGGLSGSGKSSVAAALRREHRMSARRARHQQRSHAQTALRRRADRASSAGSLRERRVGAGLWRNVRRRGANGRARLARHRRRRLRPFSRSRSDKSRGGACASAVPRGLARSRSRPARGARRCARQRRVGRDARRARSADGEAERRNRMDQDRRVERYGDHRRPNKKGL